MNVSEKMKNANFRYVRDRKNLKIQADGHPEQGHVEDDQGDDSEGWDYDAGNTEGFAFLAGLSGRDDADDREDQAHEPSGYNDAGAHDKSAVSAEV